MHSPKSLRDPEVLAARLRAIDLPHTKPLNDFVRTLRSQKGDEYFVPFFDPHDGGVDAEILFLLEAPGPRARDTGIVSRDNPDETAKNIFLLSQKAGLDRRRVGQWNVVPWYIGSKERLGIVKPMDVTMGMSTLGTLLSLLPALRTVVLIGTKAARANKLVLSARPTISIVSMPHPSPMFVNRAPEANRLRILGVLKSLA